MEYLPTDISYMEHLGMVIYNYNMVYIYNGYNSCNILGYNLVYTPNTYQILWFMIYDTMVDNTMVFNTILLGGAHNMV